ncbi:hypothetical protein C0J52_21913 [Blattella germanica]|nr:hypothetical protein C0J52_21913 [Blattella germanica]PSN37043.1 hypothetical protein C0J52_21913 [Blattella germanica]
MWTPQQKVFCVLSLAELKSVTLVQRQFRREYQLRPTDDVPTYVTIKKWDRCLHETGSLVSMSGRHSKLAVPAADVELIRTTLQRSPRKSDKQVGAKFTSFDST